MTLGGGTEVCLAGSVPATARAVRKTGRSSRGIPAVGLHPDLLEFPVGYDAFSMKVPQAECAMLRHPITPRQLCDIDTYANAR